ncbi:MAG: oligosaccharide flippase family protein [Pirellulales bacterium]
MSTNLDALSISSRLAWNTATKWLSSLTAAGIAIYLVKFQSDHLGAEGFGAASLLTSVIFVMLLCDAGLRAALGRHLAEQIARGDQQRLNELFTSSLAFVIGIGGLLAILSLVAAEPLVDAMNFAASQRADAILLVRYYVAAAVLLAFVAPTFGALVEAHHRFDLVDFAHMAEVICRLALMVVGIGVLRWGLYGWAAALLIAQTLLAAINVASAFWVCPSLRIRPQFVRREAITHTISLGGLVFLYQSMMQISTLTDPFVISYFLTSNGAGYYRPAQMAVTSAYPFVAGLSRQMKPLITTFAVGDRESAIREVLLRGTRLTILLSIPFCVILGCFATPIVYVWLGRGYEPTVWALVALALADASTHVRETQGFVMTGLNRVRVIAIVQTIGGLITIVAGIASVWWLQQRGWGYASIVGVAAPAVVTGWLQTFLISAYVGRVTGYGARRYLREAYARPLATLLIAGAGGLTINYFAGPATIVGLLACAATTGVLCVAVGWTIGFDAVDRARVQALLMHIGAQRKSAPPVA